MDETYYGKKPYEEGLRKYDTQGKETARNLLSQIMFNGDKRFEETTKIFDQKERFKHSDFFLYDHKLKRDVRFEVAVKNVWKLHGKWNHYWDDVHILYRKKSSQADFYILCNSFLDTVFTCKVEDYKECQIIEKDTKRKKDGDGYVFTRNEKFYSVPIEVGDLYYKENGKWRNV